MAETKSFDQMTEDELRKQLEKAVTDVGAITAQALTTFAKFQGQRANRLNEGLKRISKELGEDHPDYLATKLASERASMANMLFQSHAERIKNKPVPKPYEWVVFGQVLDANGSVAQGLTVRIFDRDRKYDDLLGETETDVNGEFSVTYHERDFQDVGEKLPELYVMVSDAKGTVLYSTRDDVRFRAGRSEYFLIRLGKSSPTAKSRVKPKKAK
jgi:hypothetical protein